MANLYVLCIYWFTYNIYINIYIQSKYDLHVQIMFVGIEFNLKDDNFFFIKLLM